MRHRYRLRLVGRHCGLVGRQDWHPLLEVLWRPRHRDGTTHRRIARGGGPEIVLPRPAGDALQLHRSGPGGRAAGDQAPPAQHGRPPHSGRDGDAKRLRGSAHPGQNECIQKHLWCRSCRALASDRAACGKPPGRGLEHNAPVDERPVPAAQVLRPGVEIVHCDAHPRSGVDRLRRLRHGRLRHEAEPQRGGLRSRLDEQ
mmetsp:Transcript_83826/g.233844  ORF Transcript_83826/g.233844 Transcript_83826/m.233844 type:complete len:200 (-) Transcript_83826:892-1491(-)